jgi:hypothetical protein
VELIIYSEEGVALNADGVEALSFDELYPGILMKRARFLNFLMSVSEAYYRLAPVSS